MLHKKLKRILNGKAYGWKADGDLNPMLPLTFNGYEPRGKGSSNLFNGSKPIKKEYEVWVKKKGVQAVLSGTAPTPKKDYEINSDESIKYINQWVKNDCKEALEIQLDESTLLNEVEKNKDVLLILGADYIVSERVIEILNKLCPNDFETYDVKIVNAYTNKKYYRINLLKSIYQENLNENGLPDDFIIGHLRIKPKSKLLKDTVETIFSEKLSQELIKNNISGLENWN